MVGGALSNKDNLLRLLERAADIADIIMSKTEDIKPPGSAIGGEAAAAATGGAAGHHQHHQGFARLMTRLSDLLKVIIGRGW